MDVVILLRLKKYTKKLILLSFSIQELMINKNVKQIPNLFMREIWDVDYFNYVPSAPLF